MNEGDRVTLISPDGERLPGVVLAPFHGETVIKAGRMTGYQYAFERDGYKVEMREDPK